MSTEWQLVEERWVCHLQAGCPKAAAGDRSVSHLTFLETDKKAPQKSPRSPPSRTKSPQPSHGTSAAPSPGTTFVFAQPQDFSCCFIHKNLPFVPSFTPETSWQAKPEPEGDLGVAGDGWCLLQQRSAHLLPRVCWGIIHNVNMNLSHHSQKDTTL